MCPSFFATFWTMERIEHISENPPQKSGSRIAKIVRRVLAGVMISAGAAYLALSLILVFNQIKLSNTPFDQLDLPPGDERGFAPLYLEDNSSSGPSSAPTLFPADQVGQPQDSALPAGIVSEVPLPSDLGGSEQDAASPPVNVPDYISIPYIGLNAPIIPTLSRQIEYEGRTYEQWTAPNAFAAGWHSNSAPLGEPGNTVLSGHNNLYGEVFRYLNDLRPGMKIFLYSGNKTFTYVVTTVMILKERDQPLAVRLENARWLLPSEDERLTLVTCWPYSSNSHRLIVVAVPVKD